MAKIIIDGGYKLNGVVSISGSKNAALPCIAATLLTSQPCILENVPEIGDVEVMFGIIQSIGGKVERLGKNKYKIQTQKISSSSLPRDLVRKLRASILFLGPLLAKNGQVKMAHPGGCILGKRPIGTHFEALEGLGAKFQQNRLFYTGKAKKLKGRKMFLDEVSVTATENALMAASLASGKTIIKPAACEPSVINLAQMLKKMGAKIKGEGTHTIEVVGVATLSGCQHKINADEIETGTWAIAAAITCGQITIKNAPLENLDAILYKLGQIGVRYKIENSNLLILPSNNLKASRIQIDTWPRLPTDLQPQLTVLVTQAGGDSLIHDWLYEKRLLYTQELVKMGAQIILFDPHRALVHGPTKLSGREIKSPDLRAGMAYILAGLCAQGQTIVGKVENIERGYEEIEEKLQKLGAKIKRV
jgi:UDP-N-acetylglucosamine 1-carboxyvinyltransferase